jgi:hypothetical protein
MDLAASLFKVEMERLPTYQRNFPIYSESKWFPKMYVGTCCLVLQGRNGKDCRRTGETRPFMLVRIFKHDRRFGGPCCFLYVAVPDATELAEIPSLQRIIIFTSQSSYSELDVPTKPIGSERVIISPFSMVCTLRPVLLG